MGQYAKATLLPNLPDGIKLRCVHEIDPTQIGRVDRYDFSCDTSEATRDDQHYDVYFIAGFHHTHADLAARALESGAWVVVEKPLVTTRDQLKRLLAAVQQQPNRLFAGFHMRYNPLWSYAREDLALAIGEPVHYSCIVYEVPMPRLHWYRWPNSGTRIVSNACHWLDHFLFMNDYGEPTRSSLWLGGNRETHISLELENGAVFSMCLTDIGSARLGMQDHVELRANDVTVKVDNAGTYFAENHQRVIRRKRINKTAAYARMYETICRRILDGEAGDSLESIERGAELMLDLEEASQREARVLRGRE
jgi:predicted dehydrogenase